MGGNLIDFVCASNNRTLLKNNIEKSAIFNKYNFIIQRDFANVPMAYNQAMGKCHNRYICFVHQDVFFPDNWEQLFLQSLKQINKIDQSWGL